MKVERPDLSPAEVRAKAQEWFDRQVAISSKALGSSWPEHREWVEENLKTELRQRLIARGWVPR